VSFLKVTRFISLTFQKVQSLNYKSSLSTYVLYTQSLGYINLKDAEALKIGGILVCKFN